MLEACSVHKHVKAELELGSNDMGNMLLGLLCHLVGHTPFPFIPGHGERLHGIETSRERERGRNLCTVNCFILFYVYFFL